MQFGIGILGKNYDFEAADNRARNDQRPPHPNFYLHAGRYAAALAAKTILAEPPSIPDLSDAGIVEEFIRACRPVRPSEASAVRDAFLLGYPGAKIA